MVAGLLFLALAYLAVGQATVNRSGAQTAADAAALAAAQKTRDQLAGMWVDDVRDPAKWGPIFAGDGGVDFCSRADRLAEQNGATAQCHFQPPLSYTVEVKTNKPVGDSVVPGTENVYSTAHATAVIEPLCKPPDAGVKGNDLPQLICRDKVWDLKPDDPSGLPKPNDLFDVHLADSPANDQ
ncbi:putative Flp pilus-assembly TadE/G-like protein [Streptomyces puniciscabiei]|uniref:Putative Flp pilus-assembly TadE/G-like protein n=1 Tax=Streptomyces puniciscabiei TaxID=164348 RepID=A0A542UCN7_9ACTN|nr:putative Flp pilus-assembly TadE/G-like protein [Streptomyces puniciscabiei]